MKVRDLKHRKPYPREYTLSASVTVPEYIGPMGWPMTSVRLTLKRSSQSDPSHRTCIAHISAERERYIAHVSGVSVPAAQTVSPSNTHDGSPHG